MELIAQRIYNFLYKHKSFKNDTVVAKELGYSHPEKISRLFRSDSGAKPSVDILADLTNKFGEELNIEWVLTGHGSMIKSTANIFEGKETEYGQPAVDSPAVAIQDEIARIKSSLEKLQKAALVLAGGQRPKGRPSERVAVGKKGRNSTDLQKESVLKGSASKKGK